MPNRGAGALPAAPGVRRQLGKCNVGRRALLACGSFLVLALAACVGPSAQPDAAGRAAAVRGTITYRERLALRADAFVVVQLQDVSRVDALGIVVAEQRVESPGQVPIRFEVRYDPARIDPERAYAISARILQGDRLLFVTDTVHHVITRGNPTQVDMVLRLAR